MGLFSFVDKLQDSVEQLQSKIEDAQDNWQNKMESKMNALANKIENSVNGTNEDDEDSYYSMEDNAKATDNLLKSMGMSQDDLVSLSPEDNNDADSEIPVHEVVWDIDDIAIIADGKFLEAIMDVLTDEQKVALGLSDASAAESMQVYKEEDIDWSNVYRSNSSLAGNYDDE